MDYSMFTEEEEQAAMEAIIAERDALREQVAALKRDVAILNEAARIGQFAPPLVSALEEENASLKARLAAAEEELADFVAEAVQQDCWTHQPGEPRLFSHSFMATHEGWINFLVQRGRMRRIDDGRELYVFVEETGEGEPGEEKA